LAIIVAIVALLSALISEIAVIGRRGEPP